MFIDKRYIGAHMSAAGGVYAAVQRAREAGATALQVFTRNQRQWKAAPLSEEDIARFQIEKASWGEYPISAHASYLINLASDEPASAERSVGLMADEMTRAGQLGINLVVVHPGAHKGQGVDAGVRLVAERLDEAIRRCTYDSVTVLLENTAGQGTMLGACFAELAAIVSTSTMPERYGICLDTAHAFGAGYDLRSRQGYDAMIAELDATVGLDRLKLIHVNDSLCALGSKKDRHTHIGQGEIGEQAFELLMQDSRLLQVPMILETPKGKGLDEDIMNMKVLQRLAG